MFDSIFPCPRSMQAPSRGRVARRSRQANSRRGRDVKTVASAKSAFLFSLLLGLAHPVLAQGPQASAVPTETPGTHDLDSLLSEIEAAEPSTAQPAPSPAPSSAPTSLPVYPQVIPVDSKKSPQDRVEKAPPKRSSVIEEVVVTARRTSENMQDVPVSISALSESDLRRENINSAQDLQGKVPSLVISSNSQMRNTETPAIRGQGAQFGAAPGVIIYFAEVPLPSDLVANNQGGPGKFFDLQNLQILKGSQGTLFGRNTTGGALLIEPRRPENAYTASVRAESSSLSGSGYEVVLNAPLADETLLTRVGFKYFDREGFTRDVVTGKDYDNKHFWTGRAALTWRPSEAVENYLMGYYTVSRDNGTGTVIEDINRDGINRGILGAIGLDALPPIFSGPLAPAGAGCLLINFYGRSTNCGQDILDAQRARGIRSVALSGDPNDILDTGGIVNNFSYRFDNGLILRDIASYSVFDHHFRWDLDGSSLAFIDYNNSDDEFNADLSTITNELQLQGGALDGDLTFVVGGYFERTEATGISLATALFIERIRAVYEQTKQSYAPFVQSTYDLGGIAESLSGLNLTAGARYTFDETKGFAQLTQVAAGLLTTVDNPHNAALKSRALTYNVGLDYHVGPALLFGKVSRGYKTGGMSVISVNPDHFTYDPEYVTNYEIGFKSDLLLGESPVRINGAIFYTDYDNLQKASIDAYTDPTSPSLVPQIGGATINAGSAELAGIELEGVVELFPGASLALTYGYTHAKYNEFNLVTAGAAPSVDCSGEEIPLGEVADFSCVPYQQTPEHNYSVTARYMIPIDPSTGELEASLTYAWYDRQYTSTNTIPSEEPGSWLDSQGLLNGSIRWGNIFGTTMDIQLSGSNLTNEIYRISNSNQWTFTYQRSSIYSEPRIISLQVGYRWD